MRFAQHATIAQHSWVELIIIKLYLFFIIVDKACEVSELNKMYRITEYANMLSFVNSSFKQLVQTHSCSDEFDQSL